MHTLNRFGLFTFLMFFTAILIGQQRNVRYDSLHQELSKNLSENDRMDLLLNLSWELLDADTVEGPGYSKEAYELARKLGAKEREIDAIINLAIFWEAKSRYDQSDSLFQEVVDRSEDLDYERGKAWGKFYLAFESETLEEVLKELNEAKEIFERIGEQKSKLRMMGELADEDDDLSPEEQIAEFERIAELGKRIKDPHAEGRAYFDIGQIYGHEAKRKETANYYLKAVETLPHTSMETMALAYNNLATHLEDQEASMKYHLKALDIWKETGNLKRVIIGTSNIGATYYVLGDYLKALEHHKEAQEYNKVYKDIASEIRISINHGKVYDQLEDYEQAIMYFDKAQKLAKEDEDETGEAWASLSLARVHQKKKDFNPALSNVENALRLYTLKGRVKNISECLQVKYEIYKVLGNYRLAFENLELYKSLSDSIFNEEQTRNITRLIAEHEFQQERDSIAYEQQKVELTYEQEIRRRKVINQSAIGGAGLILIILIVLYRSYLIKKRNNMELGHKNEIIGLKNAELTTKNTQITELMESEKKLAEETLALKERELTTVTMLSYEKNSILEKLGGQIGLLSDKVNKEVLPDLREIKRTIKSGLNEETWTMFMYQFEKVHPEFFNELKSKYSMLTHHDLRLCAYLKVGMDNKEIAHVSNITTAAVKKSINRMKKKMELDVDVDLREFLMG